jgi:hypothetical protein
MGSAFVEQSAAEYFKELIEEALVRQRIETGELTAYYLVNLLCEFVRADRGDAAALDAEPLALRLGQALERGGAEQRARLRSLGDVSLFMSGFFADRFRRKIVDVDYYVSVGEYAYASLSRQDESTFAEVFGELARRFVDFVDVIGEVSERSALTSNTDLLRLYEKWLRTGSRRDGQRLAERGIVPNASIGSRFIQ